MRQAKSLFDSTDGNSADRDSTATVWTIGHSTRSGEEFIALLLANGVNLIADVRKLPGSRRYPQFNQEALAASLVAERIEYRHYPGLGGRRTPLKDSKDSAGRNWNNHAWKNAAFRGFADYMQSEEFAENLASVVELAGSHRVALMCAEAVPWRCHRSLIADALVAHGLSVKDIIAAGKTQPHVLKPFAQIAGTTVTYPAPNAGE